MSYAVPGAPKPVLQIRDVVRATAQAYRVHPSKLMVRRRFRDIVRPRQVAMYLAATDTHHSLHTIAQQFGGFDHTTVIYARDLIHDKIEKGDGDVINAVAFIRDLYPPECKSEV